jgi:hypothetical protein
VARKPAVRLTGRLAANFERNLADIERFLTDAGKPRMRLKRCAKNYRR